MILISTDPRHLTISEREFMARFPHSVPVLDWYDFEIGSTKVDVKECVKNSWGRYHFFVDHHEQLLADGGVYWFALKRRIPNSDPVLIGFKWMPAACITYNEGEIEQWSRHTTQYQMKEVFRKHWKIIWPELVGVP